MNYLLRLTVLLFALPLYVRSQSAFNWSSIVPSDSLNWVDCFSPPIQCTRLNVPKNYSNPELGSFVLALSRIPSSLNGTAAYRGPVLFNPGGPGGSGVDAIVQMGAELSTIIGPEFDIVSFDPRGVANTTPRIFDSFFLTEAEAAAFDVGPRATDPTATPDALPGQWAHFQTLGHLAKDRDANGSAILPYVTTDNVAHDMLHIVQSHGREKLLYWGISYGSVLGATFAAMFPDKVERLIIDGVVDMEGYYKTDWANEVLDTDKELGLFFSECHKAGPDACAFYDTSPEAISINLDKIYAQLRVQPAVAYSPSLPAYGVVDAATLKNAIFSSFYFAYDLFGTLAQGLSDLQHGNGSVILQLSSPHADPVFTAIVCGDGEEVTDDASALMEYRQRISNVSSFSDVVVGIRTLCSGWRIHTDNFKGPIMGNTSFPLLVIGNTADPVTPLAGAIKAAKAFPGAVVLTQDSLGHTSFATRSNCTLAYVRQYFQNGTLPAPGVVCPVTTPLFPIQASIKARSLVTKPVNFWGL
ncbi:alpha/beta-hydrolase [Pholiota conissans]|uniref:Alpha/beta-hydrolase n=1 Tax=Pholiota conissans TaxID=109636 RepID=A0A9P6CMH4_9AGAR|nr:alpha/beta-hydrolase [Pholiota conissans]